jgi:ribonuclease G
MSKEMIVSCSPHETKIAILEDDQVAEVYFERTKEYTLAGSIYKGRVTRVLPGMQSAFVNVGLERDAFLYVSDFFEDAEEYDKIASTVEENVIRMDERSQIPETSPAPAAVAEPSPDEAAPEVIAEASPVAEPAALATEIVQPKQPSPASPPPRPPDGYAQQGEERQRFSRRGRRHRGHHKGFPESKYATTPPVAAAPVSVEATGPVAPAVILPGESLAKYKSRPPADESLPETHETRGVSLESAAEYPEISSYGPSLTPPATESPEEIKQDAFPKPPAEHFAGPRDKETALVAEPAIEAATVNEAAQRTSAEPPKGEMGRSPASPAELSIKSSSSLVHRELPAVEGPSELQAFETEAGSFVVTQPEQAAGAAESGESEEAAGAIEPANSEAGETPGAAAAAEPQVQALAEGQGKSIESPMPEKAAVRDRHRNPRYMRKSRWQARREREGRPEPGGSRGPRPREREAAPQPLIADLLKEGQEILVQIAKEPLGKKGARITSHIALPGRYLVYMPTVTHVGVSRKIASDEERQRLKRIILEHGSNVPGGFIVRTAGEGHSEEDIRQDIDYLSKLWAEMRAQAEKVTAPALLHHDLNLVLRILRDQLSEEFSAVWVDNEQEYERILGLVSKFQPALVNRVKLYTKDVPLFDELGIQDEINKALKPKVWLKSGGYIVINQTEALVAIDVNTGKFVGKSNRLEDTIVKTNVEAIKEIVRQIRLRDLGGIIVIDFIDMDERKNRQKVFAAIEEALKSDRSPSKLLAFNEFGLVAITRKRVRQSLERTLCQPCSYCSGSGLVKSVMSVCYEILSEARRIAPQIERKQITLRVNPEVGRSLKSRETTVLQEIEEMTGKPVIIRNDPLLHVEHFDFN